MSRVGEEVALGRGTGSLLVVGVVAVAVVATVSSSTFNWPDILRQPAFAVGGMSLVWIWFTVAWTYAIAPAPPMPALARARS